MNKIKLIYFLIFLNLFNLKSHYYEVGDNVSSIMGDFKIKNQIVADLFNSYALNRMKYIDQGGPGVYFKKAPKFTRYEHCVGVYALVKRFGASLKEQIVALLHDVSHTGFSHLADFFMRESEVGHEKSYQDSIHIQYLASTDVKDIIENYNIMDIEDLDPDIGDYKMLEKSLPDMCGDRIEYNLHTAYVYKIYSKKEIEKILSDLRYEDGSWYFINKKSALKFAKLPILFMYKIWNSPENSCMYNIFCEILKEAIRINIIKKEEFIFGVDISIFNKIKNNANEKIKELIKKCSDIEKIFYIVSDNESYDKYFKYKFRGIDPLVRIRKNNGARREVGQKKFRRLSEIDLDFKNEYEEAKKYCDKGVYIKFK
jgi:HD superfamily phosphohydrolase